MSDDLMVVVRPVEIFLPKEEKPKKVAKKRMTLAEKKAAGMTKPEAAVVSTEKLNEMLAEIGKDESVVAPIAIVRGDMFELDTLLVDLLGPEKEAERKNMEALREDAYHLSAKSKSFGQSIYAFTTQKERESGELQNCVFADVERRMFNSFKVDNGDSASLIQKKDVARAAFLQMQKSKTGTDDRVRYEALIMSKMALIPGAVERHNENQEKALQCLIDIEERKAEQEKYFLDSQEKFAAANAIAAKYGWPQTVAKKDVKDAK